MGTPSHVPLWRRVIIVPIFRGSGTDCMIPDVTLKAFFEREYLVPGLRWFAPVVTMPYTPTHPLIRLQLFLDFPVNSIFCQLDPTSNLAESRCPHFWAFSFIFICCSLSHLGWHFRMLFQSSKLEAQSRMSLLTRFSEKRHSSFEIWALKSFSNCHRRWDWLYNPIALGGYNTQSKAWSLNLSLQQDFRTLVTLYLLQSHCTRGL